MLYEIISAKGIPFLKHRIQALHSRVRASLALNCELFYAAEDRSLVVACLLCVRGGRVSLFGMTDDGCGEWDEEITD